MSNVDSMLIAKKKAPSPQTSLDVFIAVCCIIFADSRIAENCI